ncbi:MAG: hypothetical protein JO353_05995, partial [Phycisphaerae bacterium]|nr:hypothetical protein [Phycisphaerae bacterium]
MFTLLALLVSQVSAAPASGPSTAAISTGAPTTEVSAATLPSPAALITIPATAPATETAESVAPTTRAATTSLSARIGVAATPTTVPSSGYNPRNRYSR